MAALIFPGFEVLDLFGPMEMFGSLEDQFSLDLVGMSAGRVPSAQGIAAHADRTTAQGCDYDMLFVPGGPGTREAINNPQLLDWIAATSARAEFTLSVCTGSALLARAGVLDGKRATTNKAAFDWVAEQGPKVNWVRKARWVTDGKFVTSSGVSAGIDMALGTIALLHGEKTAETVAGWSEYIWNRDSDWDPFATVHGMA